MSIQLICDDRERAITPFLQLLPLPDVQIIIRRITTADFIVMFRGQILMAIERKTWQDMSGSIKDGRKENVKKLLALREETGCRLIYLIEGPARFKPGKRVGHIQISSMQAHLDHLMFRDDIHTIFSLNDEDTARRLHELIKNYFSMSPEVIRNQIKGKNTAIIGELNGAAPSENAPKMAAAGQTEGQNDEKTTENDQKEATPAEIPRILTKAFPPSDKKILYDIWVCVPYVSPKTATIFINRDIHIADFLLGRITAAEIFSMTYENGTIIGTRAKTIAKAQVFATACGIHAAMLACIPRVTRETAKIILQKINFRELLEGRVSHGALAEIKKTSKTCIGPVVAAEICRFFCKSGELVAI